MSHQRWMTQVTTCVTSDPTITEIVRQATDDLASLRMTRHDQAASGGLSRRQNRGEDSWVPAAGIPWFLTLFGRDALVVSLQTMSLSPRFALGSLRALASLQADDYDDARDMQPGKIEHEIRHGELAALHLIPHTPYFGSHEATSLYVLVAAQAWSWHADREALDFVRPNVERALSWIDTDGDLDGDGLQEYRTRSAQGYYNQGWKDAGDAIVGADGELAVTSHCPVRTPVVGDRGQTIVGVGAGIGLRRHVAGGSPSRRGRPSERCVGDPLLVGGRGHLLRRSRR